MMHDGGHRAAVRHLSCVICLITVALLFAVPSCKQARRYEYQQIKQTYDKPFIKYQLLQLVILAKHFQYLVRMRRQIIDHMIQQLAARVNTLALGITKETSATYFLNSIH